MVSVTDILKRFSLSNDVDYSISGLPERALLAAILERAYRDLHPIAESFYRKEAILWFNGKSVPRRGSDVVIHITFEFILEILELSSVELSTIQNKVLAAQAYEDRRAKEETNQLMPKRESCRESVSALASRKGMPICQENGTVLRKQRRFRRYG